MFKLLIIVKDNTRISSSIADYETREQAEIAYTKISSSRVMVYIDVIKLYN